MINKICIIGLGLIGGSFAKSIKNTNQAKVIIGIGRDESKLKVAQKFGAIDEYSLNFDSVSDADLVLIATPINSFTEVLQSIKPHLKDNAIITDVGSTKVSVIAMAKSVFGEIPANFIPAHPIAGKEKSGFLASDSTLFKGKIVILTPAANANSRAIEIVSQCWQSIGATVENMSPKKHDDLLAITSHLPHMLAFGLMDYLINNNPKAFDYAAGGFKDFSRIASSNAVMWRDICLNNDEKIIKHIKGYQQTLSQLIELIKTKNDKQIELLFSTAKQNRDKWLQRKKYE